MRKTWICACSVLVLSIFPVMAQAQDVLASAKDLNRQGLEFFDAGDYAQALPLFESSRALVASHANTRNVALSLDALGRAKEALAMYEVLLRDYHEKLLPDERAATEQRIAELRAKLEPPKPVLPSITAVHPKAAPPQRTSGGWTAGVFLGYARGATLGNDVEARAAVEGMVMGGRVGYRFRPWFALEASVGYLALNSVFRQDFLQSMFVYRVDEQRTLMGGFGALGASFRLPLGSRWAVFARFGLGPSLANVTSTVRGESIGANGDRAPLSTAPNRPNVTTYPLLFLPEIGGEIAAGKWILGIHVGGLVAMVTDEGFGHLSLETDATQCKNRLDAACAPDKVVAEENLAQGAFAVFTPQLSVRYQFD